MNRNVIVKSIGSYHPKKVIDNKYYLDHFKKIKPELIEEAKEYFEELGREKRIIADKDENILTMSIESAKDSDYAKYFRFPRCGMSKVLDTSKYTYISIVIF